MHKNLALVFVLCFTTTTGFAQSPLSGKWATDRLADPQLLTEAQRKQGVQLEVTIVNAKASGTLNIGGLGGTFYSFEDGKVITDNKVQFQTGTERTLPTWTITLVDENTVKLSRGNPPMAAGNVPDLIAVLPGFRQSAPSAQSVPTQVSAIAAISGNVLDSTKALIPGAKVTATNVDTGLELTTVTNSSGRYAFAAAIPGRYTLTASLPGFKTVTVSNLTIGDTPFLRDLTLELGGAQASANPSSASCSPENMTWCAMLHRAK